MQTLNTEETSVVATLACVQAAMETTPGRRCWCKSREGIYLWCNGLFAEDMCRTIPDIVGASTAEILPDDWVECERVGQLVMETRRSIYDHPEMLTLPSGGVLSTLISRSPMLGIDGDVIGLIGYYDRAQSEVHKRAEVQLILALVPADSREQIRNGLAALREEFTC